MGQTGAQSPAAPKMPRAGNVIQTGWVETLLDGHVLRTVTFERSARFSQTKMLFQNDLGSIIVGS